MMNQYKVLLLSFACFINYRAHSQMKRHSELYWKIDSIMRYQLNFNVDSAEVAVKTNLNKSKLIIRDAPEPPAFPLIILNGNIVNRNELEHYRMSMVNSIQVMKRETAIQFSGSQARYGVIAIVTK